MGKPDAKLNQITAAEPESVRNQQLSVVRGGAMLGPGAGSTAFAIPLRHQLVRRVHQSG